MTINEAIEILGLQQPVTLIQVKQQFHAKARELHPDVSGSDTHHLFVEITVAYELLKDKTEFELNNQIFKTRTNHNPLHKANENRGAYTFPDSILVQDLKNVIYFSYKYFNINWVDIIYNIYTKTGKQSAKNKFVKYIQSVFLIFLMLIALPVGLAFLFCSTIFYIIQIALLSDSQKLKHQRYYILWRQLLMGVIALVFFYAVMSFLPMFLSVSLIVFTLPAVCLVQVSILYSFLNRN